MTHLSREELRRWWQDGAPPDSERITAHLAVCDECVALYGDVMDDRPLESAPPAVSPELVAAGHAAYRGAGEALGSKPAPSRIRWIAPLGAAAALVAAVVLYPLLRSEAPLVAPEDQAVRSTTIQAVSPAGTVSPPFAFEWSSPIEASSYMLVVYDETGKTLWSSVTNVTRIEMPPALMARLTPGAGHTWQVTAINQRGERTIQSPRQAFVVSPRVP